MTKSPTPPGAPRIHGQGPVKLAVLACLVVAGGAYAWCRSGRQPPASERADRQANEQAAEDTAAVAEPSLPGTEARSPHASDATTDPSGPDSKVTRGGQMDPVKREEIRRLIWQALTHAAPPDAAAPKRGAEYVLPDKPPWEIGPPVGSDAAAAMPAAQIEPKYIQERVRNDFFPPARDCYSAGLARDPTLAGKIVFAFNIVGDAKTGGIVETVDVLNESTLRDPAVIDCMRQSFLSVVFPAPANGGEVTVVYPIIFSNADE